MRGTKANNKKTVKKNLTRMAIILLSAVIGFLFGAYMAEYISNFAAGASSGEVLVALAGGFIALCIAVFLQVIIHESGHLIFGILTGYRFSSFRIGSFMWVKQDEAIKFRRLSLAGTGGQCLMGPPDMKGGTMPYVLYNLGGSMLNILSAAVFFVLFLLSRNVLFLSIFSLFMIVIGILFATINGIPLKLGAVNNDGHNALSLGKNPEAMRAFWIQLKISEQIAAGIRIKDMPDEWFTMPSPQSLKNSMVSAIGVFACNRLMDAMDFEKADQIMSELLDMDTGMVGLHRSLLVVDRLYCELIGENRKEILDGMLDKNQKKFMKIMKNYPSILRTEYAYALLAEKDIAKADKKKVAFESIAGSYPYPQEIDSERELMEYAEKIYLRL
jgi:hypothetical protein